MTTIHDADMAPVDCRECVHLRDARPDGTGLCAKDGQQIISVEGGKCEMREPAAAVDCRECESSTEVVGGLTCSRVGSDWVLPPEQFALPCRDFRPAASPPASADREGTDWIEAVRRLCEALGRASTEFDAVLALPRVRDVARRHVCAGLEAFRLPLVAVRAALLGEEEMAARRRLAALAWLRLREFASVVPDATDAIDAWANMEVAPAISSEEARRARKDGEDRVRNATSCHSCPIGPPDPDGHCHECRPAVEDPRDAEIAKLRALLQKCATEAQNAKKRLWRAYSVSAERGLLDSRDEFTTGEIALHDLLSDLRAAGVEPATAKEEEDGR